MFDPSELDLELDPKEKKKTTSKEVEKKTEKEPDKEQPKAKIEEKEAKIKIEKKEIPHPNPLPKGEGIEQEKEDDILGDLDSTPEKPEEKEEEEKSPHPNPLPKSEGIEQKNEEVAEEEKKEDTTVNLENLVKTAGDQKSDDKEEGKKEKEEKKVVTDINIRSITDILNLLIDNEYDFVIIEPDEANAKITFKKDKLDSDIRYVKYPVYSQILLKAKTSSNLDIDTVTEEQEGNSNIVHNSKTYKLITKTVPSAFGEKLFVKATEQESKKVASKKQKTSPGKILGFLGAAVITFLILGGAFLTFIVLNAKTPEDVAFFTNLGINLNQINAFVQYVATMSFSILVFIETVFLVIFIFKFLLTKKEFKKRRIRYGIVGTLFLLLTFITASSWMIIDKKIRSLPNWAEEALGLVVIYDNSKLISDKFDEYGALQENTRSLIGPITLKYDLSTFEKKEIKKGFNVEKYIWNFGDGEIIERIEPSVTKEFTRKGNYKVSVSIEGTDASGSPLTKEIDSISPVGITNIVRVTEEIIDNGGKIVQFDASDLESYGKIEWYFVENQIIEDKGKQVESGLDSPAGTGPFFKPGKPFFEETLIGMYVGNNTDEDKYLDKIFIISGDDETGIDGEIAYTTTIDDDLNYEFYVKDVQNSFNAGYIEKYTWNIEGKEEIIKGDIILGDESPKIEYRFKNYGTHTVSVSMENSNGETKEISIDIVLNQNMQLRSFMQISNNGEKMRGIVYEKKNNEYYINDLGVPTTLTFDAKGVRSKELIYSLKKVEWDTDNDGDKDEEGKTIDFDVNIEGDHTVAATYIFVHRKDESRVVRLTEMIYIQGVKKEALLDLKIEKDSTYVPVIVRFDASRSTVKDENIIKFIYDFGDGIKDQESDAIVPGHKYSKAGEYIVKLKVRTESGKEFSIEKNLVLQEKPQEAKISTSLKRAPIGQGIDFSSEDSEGQIVGYFWDFGDGTNSISANPSHKYKRAGIYQVKLKLDFSNKNIEEDEMEIEIYDKQ